MALLRVGREAADRRLEIAGEHEVRILRQVVEQRGGFVEEQRQVVLDAGRRHAVADVLVDRRAARVAFEGLAPAAAEGRARGFVERKLAAGQEAHVAYRVEAALRVRVERADRVDLVVEQVDPVRQRRLHRVQVDQRAAHAVFAGPHDLAHVLVAGQRELRLQLHLVEALALRECERVRGHERRGRHPVQRGGRGHEQDVAAAFAEVVQRGQPLGHEIPAAARTCRTAAFPSPAAGARARRARSSGFPARAAARRPRSRRSPRGAARPGGCRRDNGRWRARRRNHARRRRRSAGRA